MDSKAKWGLGRYVLHVHFEGDVGIGSFDMFTKINNFTRCNMHDPSSRFPSLDMMFTKYNDSQRVRHESRDHRVQTAAFKIMDHLFVRHPPSTAWRANGVAVNLRNT